MALTKVSTGMLSADAASVDLNIDAGTMFIDASANRVGIGNTSPATALDVTGTVTASGPIILTAGALAAAGNAGLSHRSTDNKVYLQAGTGGFNILDDQQNTHFAIDSAGVSSFYGNVDVTGTVTATKLVSANGVLELDDNGTHNGVINAPASLFINIDSDANNTGEDFVIGKDRTGTSGGTELFRVQEDGNVGIGTSTATSIQGFAKVLKVEDAGSTSIVVSGDVHEAEYAVSANGGWFGTSTNIPQRFVTNNTERMRIDASGNVAIGGDINGNGVLTLNTPTDSSPQIVFSENNTGKWLIGHRHDGDHFRFYDLANSAERMRIDASGNVKVGYTGTGTPGNGNTDTGHLLKSDGRFFASSASNSQFNRNSDGDILTFRASGVSVGSIGTLNANRLYFGGADTGIMIASDLDCIYPTNGGDTARDNAVDLGNSGTRFKDLYLSSIANIGTYLRFGGASNYYVHSDNANYLRFGSNGSEVARFDNSGNLLVGKTVTTYTTDGFRASDAGFGASRTSGTVADINRNGTDGNVFAFYKAGSNVGSIAITTSATAYNTSSDYRLKDNIVDAPSASDDIDAIQVRSFDWKADGSHQKYGMVAQELLEVAPSAVSQPEDPEEMMGVDYSKLVPMLVKEIQSLRARVAQLES